MNRKLFIFDFDGTLAATLPVFLRIFDEAAGKYGFRRLDRSLPLRHLDARRLMALHGIPPWKVPMIAAFMRSRMAQCLHEVRLFDGMEAVLRELRARGVLLAIVSSNSLSNVRTTLGPQITALFSQVECGASLFGKPSKLRKVLAVTGIAADDAILIGDELRDARAAAEAGIAFGAVAWGYNQLDVLLAEQPARVFRQVGDLLNDTAPFRPG
ncbi:HAD hydrolase-like protein [Duganella callida]|uniref:HAD family hydrolase n=1 Tax=Duganella callida TaxID=2561932 RepID=A0A4Y9S665_9BURK|nr:HAD hydrolase-like protein [Duganella callida]TFW16859.1 HAD family hydrolase [Duganella callida]